MLEGFRVLTKFKKESSSNFTKLASPFQCHTCHLTGKKKTTNHSTSQSNEFNSFTVAPTTHSILIEGMIDS